MKSTLTRTREAVGVIMKPAHETSETATMIVVDALPLRRAGLSELLRIWAEGLGLEIFAVGPEGLSVLSEHDVRRTVAIVLSLGEVSIRETDVRQLIDHARRLFAATPLVVVSDRHDPGEIILAFQEGARGFIPTSTEPALALASLSFVLAGGSYFPPSALVRSGAGRVHLARSERRPIHRTVTVEKLDG
ncbi:MAG: response regulator transcription factor [Blastochloris sp.]|nr:response regulator transcription factor [Blastochloris sp.]